MLIQVKLASCCQPFLFNLDGETVIYSHESNKNEIVKWDNLGDIKIFEFPFPSLNNDKFLAHQELTDYLTRLGVQREGYDLGEFFNLQTRETTSKETACQT